MKLILIKISKNYQFAIRLFFKQFVLQITNNKSIINTLLICIKRNDNQKTSDIQINVKTESLEKTKQAQQLSLEINKNSLDTPEYLSITIDNIESILTLVSAKRNNEDLWLLNSSSPSSNEKVISWNFDKEKSQLNIYPYNWNSAYVLDLNIQVNFKNISSIESETSTTIILTAELGGRLFEALPSGEGNNIQIR